MLCLTSLSVFVVVVFNYVQFARRLNIEMNGVGGGGGVGPVRVLEDGDGGDEVACTKLLKRSSKVQHSQTQFQR